MSSLRMPVRMLMFGNEPSGSGSSQFFSEERTPRSKNSCCSCRLQATTNVLIQHSLLLNLTSLWTCPGSSSIMPHLSKKRKNVCDLLLKHMHELWKHLQFFNCRLGCTVKISICLCCNIQLCHKLFNKHGNLLRGVLKLFALLTTFKKPG